MTKSASPIMEQTVVLPPQSGTVMEAPCQKLVQELIAKSLMLSEDWEALPTRAQRRILESRDESKALDHLVKHGLLTPYQAGRISAGTTFGLVLGSYRVLERLGAGGMAVVFKGEHMDLRHHVAIKVLPPTTKEDSALESRFFAEMRIVARLRHPNIIAANDAGRVQSEDDNSILRYLVMEYVAGSDLEDIVRKNGAMSLSRACSIAYQIASALGETHKYGLVHRDIKPSNIMLTGEDQAKLLDFGLTRHFGHRMTVPGTILGTIDYMAPEQARDASTVDIRADIFGLGGILFWCLSGQLPFPAGGSPFEALSRRLNAATPSIREICPNIPEELDAVIAKMMALRPEDRYAEPQEVMRALLPFVRPGSGEFTNLANIPMVSSLPVVSLPEAPSSGEYRVLVVDDESSVRELCKQLLEAEGTRVETASNGTEGLARALEGGYDLILLDIAMPDMNGVEVLTRLRAEQGPGTHQKVLMFSGHTTPEEMSEMLNRGADDFLTKPFSISQLLARVQNLLRMKAEQDRTTRLYRQLQEENAAMARSAVEGSSGPDEIRNGLVLAMAHLVEQREGRGTGHPLRMRKYCRVLAEAAAVHPQFQDRVDCAFVDLLECCAPLHDIGRIGLPDHVILKTGPLSAEERLSLETHTVLAEECLKELTLPEGMGHEAFLKMAREVTRSHHERHDGTGYPDQLVGENIPLAARFVGIADAYDSLRVRRPQKPALSHTSALQVMGQDLGRFDPALLEVFQQVAGMLDQIFRDTPD